MKTKDVEVGGTYLARVSDRLVRVVVVACLPPETRNGRLCPQMFRLRREGKQEILPKSRAAAALRPCTPHDTVQKLQVNSMYGKKCKPIEGEGLLPGWGCCQCQVYNGYQRNQCKHCGHTRCCEIPASTPVIGVISVDSPEELEGLESYLVEGRADAMLDEVLKDPAPSPEELVDGIPPTDRNSGSLLTIDARSAYPDTIPQAISSIVVSKAEYDTACQDNLAWCKLCLKFVDITAWLESPRIGYAPCPQCNQSPVYAAEYALKAGYIALNGGPENNEA